MGSRQTNAIIHGLCQLADGHAQLTDGQLLARFAAERDERAFETLLHRHAPLVYGVCRNLLRQEQDAEDAFQGTFLVLVRLAGTIREEKALASWLHRVAYRVAMKARRSADRRRRREEEVAKPPEEKPTGELAWRELQAMLDEELNRLPEKYRAPFVLCCLLGMSKAEAAAELGWPEGTVSSRLVQARELLRTRLARRGVSLSAILGGLAVAQDGARAAVSPALLATTQKAALAFAAGQAPLAGAAPAPVVLARAALRGQALGRLKTTLTVLILASLVGGAAFAFQQRPATEPGEPPPQPVAPAAVPGPALALNEPLPGTRMTVAGSVVGPDGKAVPGARVAVVASRRRRAGEPYPERLAVHLLGEGRADERGQFRLTLPRATAEHYRLTAFASAPGFALGDNMADPAAVTSDEHTLPITLGRGHTVRVRLTDKAGKPAKGVAVHLLGMTRNGPDGVFAQVHDLPVPLPGWPGPLVTDADGLITLRDIGPGTRLLLQARDERFANEWLAFTTPKTESAEPVGVALSDPRVLEGRLLAEDTNQPLANATVIVESRAGNTPPGYAEARTDREGRYRVRPFPGDTLDVWLYPAADQPYVPIRQQLTWPPDAAKYRADDLPVPRGVLVRGTVLEAGTGKAVAGAAVSYEWAYKDNPFRTALRNRRGVQWELADAGTDAEGVFRLTVPPGPGTLLVKAAEPDYVHVETSTGQLHGGKPAGGIAFFPDAVFPLALAPNSDIQTPVIPLRRGINARGRVLNHDGKPAASALLLSPTYVPDGMELKGRTLPVRDGKFELPGCEPGAKTTVWVFDPVKQEGGFAEFTVKEGTEPEVRLAPCVSVHVRVVDGAGKPVAQPHLAAELVLRPGDSINESLRKGTRPALGVWTSMTFGLAHGAVETELGAGTLSCLIPNAPYNIRAEGKPSWPEYFPFTAPAAGEREITVVVGRPRPK